MVNIEFTYTYKEDDLLFRISNHQLLTWYLREHLVAR